MEAANLKKVVTLSLVLLQTSTVVAESHRELSSVRYSHAKELLGHGYQKKVIRPKEKADDIPAFVKAACEKFTPRKYKKMAPIIAAAVLENADRYAMDPLFILAVIQNESSFQVKMKGGVGEIGLMQIKPSTAAWISKLYGIPYKSEKSLYDVKMNIRVGAALMDKLRKQFESRSGLYVSAYNVGATRLREMLEDDYTPHDYVRAVMKRYIALYEGYKAEGNLQAQVNVAYSRTLDITRKVVANSVATN